MEVGTESVHRVWDPLEDKPESEKRNVWGKVRMKPNFNFADLQVRDACIVCPTRIMKIFKINPFHPKKTIKILEAFRSLI